MELFGQTNLIIQLMPKVIMKELEKKFGIKLRVRLMALYVASSGTGGTISGVSNALKEKNKDIKILFS